MVRRAQQAETHEGVAELAEDIATGNCGLASFVGVAPHLDALGVVDQAVENAIGQGGIADLFVPAPDWQLRAQDRRAQLVAVLANSQKSRRSGSNNGANAHSSIAKTSIRARRANRFRKLFQAFSE